MHADWPGEVNQTAGAAEAGAGGARERDVGVLGHSERSATPCCSSSSGEEEHRCYLVGAVGVGDPGEGLQGGGDGVGQDEGPRRRTVLLHLTHKHTAAGGEDGDGGGDQRLTMSDSRQDTSWRTQGSRQLWFRFTFWREVSVRIWGGDKQLEPEGRRQDVLARADTFWILVLVVDAMVVGGTNWKVGAALLGYWAGNLTTRWTWWLPKWAETTQLQFTASICIT